jgi:hypothetical protein
LACQCQVLAVGFLERACRYLLFEIAYRRRHTAAPRACPQWRSKPGSPAPNQYAVPRRRLQQVCSPQNYHCSAGSVEQQHGLVPMGLIGLTNRLSSGDCQLAD